MKISRDDLKYIIRATLDPEGFHRDMPYGVFMETMKKTKEIAEFILQNKGIKEFEIILSSN